MARKFLFSYSTLIIVHSQNGMMAVSENFEVIVEAEDEKHTLSIVECRKYLKGVELTDKQVLAIRDCLCVLLDNVLDNYFEKHIGQKSKIKNYIDVKLSTTK